MAIDKPRSLLRIEYEEAAEAYLRSLPPEHFMEGTPQATQREITVESFALVKLRRPDLHYFNELLVQYPLGRAGRMRQVVPDNMAVLFKGEIRAEGSFDVPLQPVGPFWVLEYVSKKNKRKDYEESFRKYERELKVEYCLLFYPDAQELSLYHHTGRKYRTVTPNEAGRYAVPDLEVEVALLEGWVRYWFRGKLLPLPAELQRALDDTRRQLVQMKERFRRERQEKERLLAKLRDLGIDPSL